VSLVAAPADCEEDEALARVAAVRARFGAIAERGRVVTTESRGLPAFTPSLC
jgi:hypothetical protein